MERGSDANARAATDQAGVGGQTPIFHAVSQFDDWGGNVGQCLGPRPRRCLSMGPTGCSAFARPQPAPAGVPPPAGRRPARPRFAPQK
jgi:hypothetical protein